MAGVEVSTDGGVTWSAATGTTSWTYTFRQRGLGSSPIRVRAMDDSANIGTAVTRAFNAQCPCSIFGNEVPRIAAADDPFAVEVGVRFVPLADGFVTGVRFYKGTGNSGTHVGSLWSSAGERLGQATFTGESATGWQSVTFATPVAVAAGQPYVASYTAPNGDYALESWGFSAGPKETGALTVDGGYGAPAGGAVRQPGTVPEPEPPERELLRRRQLHHDRQLLAHRAQPVPAARLLAACRSAPTVSARFSKPLTAGSAALVLKDSNGTAVAGTTAYDAVDPDRDLHAQRAAGGLREVHRQGHRHRHLGQPGHHR